MSVIFKDLCHKKMKVIEEYYFQVRENEKYYLRDFKTALKLQSYFRLHKRRKEFLLKRAAAIKIQKFIRRVLALIKFKLRFEMEVNRRNISYFSNQAKIMQK